MPQDPPHGADSLTVSAFSLPDRLAAKRDPALIDRDERQFAAIAAHLAETIAALESRVTTRLSERAESGGEAVERDLEVHRSSERLRALRRHSADLCLGRLVLADEPEPVYIGRIGLTGDCGERLLVDWRSPAAEPFFGATRAVPMDVHSRRRYRWTNGSVTDYWDESFDDEVTQSAALDDDSAFIESLGGARTERMRDVLGTIQADQDAIIRAGSRGALVVDGGPGTGKTVVALHRAAYLLYAEPSLESGHGGLLVVGPHVPYLSYVADVLPSLGEDGVQTCTLASMVAEGAAAVPEAEAAVAGLKGSAGMERMVENAVRLYERPPRRTVAIDTALGQLELSPDDRAEAFDAAEPGSTHSEGRQQVEEALLAIAADQLGEEVDDLPERRAARDRSWPLLDAPTLVRALWAQPAYLERSAPWLTAADRALLRRSEDAAWTHADLPILDAARARLGDPTEARRTRQRQAVIASERERIQRVVDDLIASASIDEAQMLRHQDLRDSLIDDTGFETPAPDALAGPFGHIVVDEAQELTDAEWQMLLRRCPSRSLTIVGDRAQARAGFRDSWVSRLERVGIRDARVAPLSVNYRTPEEVMAEAAPVILAALPDANVPTSIRASGLPVVHGAVSSLESVLAGWLADHEDGIACVISTDPQPDRPRVRSLTPQLAKGLEFDLVVLLDSAGWSAVDRYVAMTRATQQLVLLGS